jgi:chromosome segregation ATPase
MPHQWAALAVSIAANLLIIGIFVGSLRQTVTGLKEALAGLSRRMDEYDDFGHESRNDRTEIRARLIAAEQGLAAIRAVSDKLSEFRAATEVEHRYTREKLDALGRDMASQQRQMANVAQMRPGAFHEIRAGSDS